MFGDEHTDAFLIGPLKTPGASERSGELFSGSDAEMMDARAGSEDKKHTKDVGEKESGRVRRGKAMIDTVLGQETKIRR